MKPSDRLTIRGVPDLRPKLYLLAAVAAAPGAIELEASNGAISGSAPIDYVELGPAAR